MAGSCQKNDSPASLPDDELVAVQFSSNIGGLAIKAAGIKPLAVGSTWDSNDAIGVFMVDNGANTVRNAETNKKYVTATGNSNFAPADPTATNTVYYPVNGDKVDFIAYYPYTSSITTLGDYSVNVATQTTPANIDLLYAKATNSGSGYDKDNTSAVALTFGHQLSKLTLNVTAAGSTQIAPADLTTMTVKIGGLNTQASFNLATGTLGTASAVADITPYTATAGQKYEAILLPGNFSGVSVTFTITDGSNPGNYVWNIPNGAFEAGKDYRYSVSFTGTSGDVSVTGTIVDWETPPAITLIAPLDEAAIDENTATFPLSFQWTQIPEVADYTFKLSPNSAFPDDPSTIVFPSVAAGSQALTAAYCDKLLGDFGLPLGATSPPLYWTVVPTSGGTGVATVTRKFTVTRRPIPTFSALVTTTIEAETFQEQVSQADLSWAAWAFENAAVIINDYLFTYTVYVADAGNYNFNLCAVGWGEITVTVKIDGGEVASGVIHNTGDAGWGTYGNQFIIPNVPLPAGAHTLNFTGGAFFCFDKFTVTKEP
jgi:hypothetical protein